MAITTGLTWTTVFVVDVAIVIGILLMIFCKRRIWPVHNPWLQFMSSRVNGPDVVVIGSGILGSAMACTLARDGRKVTVIERDLTEPDRIVGELLQPGGRRTLKVLGLDACTEGIDAFPVKGAVIHNPSTGGRVDMPYTKGTDFSLTFRNGRFVTQLRQAAMVEKNVTYIEAAATKLVEQEGVVMGVEYRENGSNDTKKVLAPLTIAADGHFSKFRKQLAAKKPLTRSHFVGVLIENCPRSEKDYLEVILADPCPILVYQVSPTCTRIVAIVPYMPKSIKEHLKQYVCPQLPENLRDVYMESIDTERISSMPNWFLPPSHFEKPGVLILGDAYNMRHPITGGGMTVGLNDVDMWRCLLGNIPDLSDYDAITKAQRIFELRRKANYSFAVDVFAEILFSVFSAGENGNMRNLREAFTAYLQLGGSCLTGPVSVFSILNAKPHILIGHLLAITAYGMYLMFVQEGWRLDRSVAKSLGLLWVACSTLCPLVWKEVIEILL